jgi:hypothetical protein
MHSISPWSLRSVLGSLTFLICTYSHAQNIDSVHVFKQLPPAKYTSASATALAWQLHQQHAAFTTVKGDELSILREALAGYTPGRHTFGDLPDLSNLAIAFSGGRALAFGVADDMDLVINFTARTEYRISSLSDHLGVRALLVKMLLTR